jgi:hypothetical protein
MVAKPEGVRGSWFAKWQGNSIPCVHKHWMKPEDKRLVYSDPYVTTGPRWMEFVDAIMTDCLVILTDDRLEPGTTHAFKRTGYIGLYKVDNVRMDAEVLKFDFVDRLASFS